jgi:hypothetical protein
VGRPQAALENPTLQESSVYPISHGFVKDPVKQVEVTGEWFSLLKAV